MPWTTRDIVALTLLKRTTSADVMRLVHECDDLAHALETFGGGGDLFATSGSDLDGGKKNSGSGKGLSKGAEASLAGIAETSLSHCEKLGVRVVTWLDDNYPKRLRALPTQPAVLYVRGTLPDEDVATIAVVGTRTCSLQYGRAVTDMLVRTWCRHGEVIVSGLAAGIDTHAHEACVASRGRTLAVIASGIDRITPTDARRIADNIVEHNGAIISEYRCGVAALPPYFPARNRIICGLSDVVVVVESKRTGGALITAAFAKQYNRPLYAVPGPITSSRSEGTNELIRSGRAIALLHPDDLYTTGDPLGTVDRYTGVLQCDSSLLHERSAVLHSPTRVALNQTRVLHSPTRVAHRPLLEPLTSALQRSVIEALSIEPMHIDALAIKCCAPVHELLSALLELELLMYVERLPAQRYALAT